MTVAATPQPGRQKLPECYQNDCADQRSENGDTIHVDITNPIDDDDLCKQPGTNDAEGKPPADKSLCHEADDRRYDQVHEKVKTERPDIATQLNGDTICQNKIESEHLVLLLNEGLISR